MDEEVVGDEDDDDDDDAAVSRRCRAVSILRMRSRAAFTLVSSGPPRVRASYRISGDASLAAVAVGKAALEAA